MGTVVYLGTDLEHNRDVIIRVLPQSLFGDEEMCARFMQGINLVKNLHHSNILSVLDAGVEKDIEYVVTNYEKGFFLNDYLEHRGELDENEAIMLIKALGEALDYAWNAQQIIHRNVCPDTILVAKHNVPLLTDFDLAKSLINDSKLTCAGYTIGDPTYMSPEQAKGEDVDFRSDMYCLGLVFYQLLAGKPPFTSKSRVDTLYSQISGKHAPIQTKNKRITAACSAVLDKMLAKDRNDRYQSWKALIDELDAIINKGLPSAFQDTADQVPSNNYKMQAINMAAAKAPIAVKPEAGIAPKEETSSFAVSPEIATTHASASKRNAFIIVLVVSVIIAGVLIKLMHNKPNDIRDEPKNQAGLSSEINPVSQPESDILPPVKSKTEAALEPLEAVEQKVQATAKPEEKQITQPEPKTIPPVKPKTVTPPGTAAVLSDADKAKEEKHRLACMNNIKQIGVALLMYANVFEGKFPEASGAKGLNQLRSGGFLEHPQAYICPATGNMPAAYGKPITEECCDYVYVGGLSGYSDRNTPILWCKPENHKDYGNILYANGEVKAVAGNNWLSQTKPKK